MEISFQFTNDYTPSITFEIFNFEGSMDQIIHQSNNEIILEVGVSKNDKINIIQLFNFNIGFF